MSLAGFRVFGFVGACGVVRSTNLSPPEDYSALGFQPHRQEFCHRRGVFFQQNRGTIGMACAQAVVMRCAPTAARRLGAAPHNQQPLPL